MAVTIKINPFSDTLDMYGEPDRSAAYSLSGTISISLSSPFSLFERRRAVRLLLRSLTIVFEGQSELISQEMGYVPYRLCRVAQELVLGDPVELTNEGHEDSDRPCTWDVVFNLTVPGWLPATTTFGDVGTGEAGTRYALYATAKFDNVDDGTGRSWLSALCSPFHSRSRTVNARRCSVQLNRLVTSLGETSSSASQTVNYSVLADGAGDASRIPADTLSKLRVVASVPEYVDMTESSFTICLRMRTDGLAESETQRLRVAGFNVEVEQVERYRSSPSPAYTMLYPVPCASEQPPQIPLLNSNPFQSVFDMGITRDVSCNRVCARSFSVLPPHDEARHYLLAGDGHVFTPDTAAASDRTRPWYSIHTDIPFVQTPYVHVPENFDGAYGGFRLRESAHSPLFSVTHRLHVALVCSYDLPDGERVEELLRFNVPLRFARIYTPSSRAETPVPVPLLSGHSPASSVDSACCALPGLRSALPCASLPYAQTLPAYSQLFDANGERKIDYSVPLPLYTPRSPSSEGGIEDEMKDVTSPPGLS
ncbi:hypothetical protein B0H21DRAFT_563589 [Amylocystis lapponica]|nr:hypothetical protein B0H21DRAFT_563589 [Amylocystis lapponica]